MNEERQGVGTMGVALSTTAYLHALSYAKERMQGVNIMQMKDPNAKQCPIIQHPDIRGAAKMKSITEAIKRGPVLLLCHGQAEGCHY